MTSRIATNVSSRLGIVRVVALSWISVRVGVSVRVSVRVRDCGRCQCRDVSKPHVFDHLGRHVVTELFDLFPNVT